MAGTERIELPLTEPESVVLPLDEVPIRCPLRLNASRYFTGTICVLQVPFWTFLIRPCLAMVSCSFGLCSISVVLARAKRWGGCMLCR